MIALALRIILIKHIAKMVPNSSYKLKSKIHKERTHSEVMVDVGSSHVEKEARIRTNLPVQLRYSILYEAIPMEEG